MFPSWLDLLFFLYIFFFFVKLFGQDAAGLALAFHSTFFLEGVLLYSARPGGVARQLRDCSSRNLLLLHFFLKILFSFFFKYWIRRKKTIHLPGKSNYDAILFCIFFVANIWLVGFRLCKVQWRAIAELASCYEYVRAFQWRNHMVNGYKSPDREWCNLTCAWVWRTWVSQNKNKTKKKKSRVSSSKWSITCLLTFYRHFRIQVNANWVFDIDGLFLKLICVHFSFVFNISSFSCFEFIDFPPNSLQVVVTVDDRWRAIRSPKTIPKSSRKYVACLMCFFLSSYW